MYKKKRKEEPLTRAERQLLKRKRMLNTICKECGRERHIPMQICRECWKELNESITD